MQTPLETIAEKSKTGAGVRPRLSRLLWARLVELWIFLAILWFFLIRVLGSLAVQKILGELAHAHHP